MNKKMIHKNTLRNRAFCFHVKFLIFLNFKYFFFQKKRFAETLKANTYDEPSELEIECRLPARVGTTSIER